MILRLADIMFLHDPLNEEALAAKCAVFSAQGKVLHEICMTVSAKSTVIQWEKTIRRHSLIYNR